MMFTKILMSINKLNLFDKSQPLVSQAYLNQDDTISSNRFWKMTGYIQVDGLEFKLIRDSNIGTGPCIIGYDSDKKKITHTNYNNQKDIVLISDKKISYIRFSISTSENLDNIKLIKIK